MALIARIELVLFFSTAANAAAMSARRRAVEASSRSWVVLYWASIDSSAEERSTPVSSEIIRSDVCRASR